MLKTNDHPDFVGIGPLLARHLEQAGQFAAWQSARRWDMFHRGHYDWWAFPIDEPSGVKGYRYVVGEAEIQRLRERETFLLSLRFSLKAVATSWNYDLAAGQPHPGRPDPDQHWQHWPVRLYKMHRSASLFGLDAERDSLRAYGSYLLFQGERFTYAGHDLSGPFRQEASR